MRPRLGLVDVLLQLWRAKFLMFLVFLSIVLAGFAITLLFPTTYTTTTRLQMTGGVEGGFGGERGAMEEGLASEVELARSPVVAERVIARVGAGRLFPGLVDSAEGAEAGPRTMQAMVGAFLDDLNVRAAPRAPIMTLSFTHEDGELAAETLNEMVEAYIAYRSEILARGAGLGLTAQREAIEQDLRAADGALRDYLAANQIADFDAELADVSELLGSLAADLVDVRADLSGARGRARGLAIQLEQADARTNRAQGSTAGRRVADLELERQELLARYKPESQVVRDIDTRINQLRTYVSEASPEDLSGADRNLTQQSLEIELALARATVVGMEQREVELARQRAQIEVRRRELAAIEPGYRRLARDRDGLEATAQLLAREERTGKALNRLDARAAGTVNVLEAAAPPAQGASPRHAIAALAAFLGAVAAIAIGLVRAWSIRGLPTGAAVQRTLGLRVLATAGER